MEQRLQHSTTLGNQLAILGRMFDVYMQDVRQVDKDENVSISIVGQRYLNVKDFEGRETTYEDEL